AAWSDPFAVLGPHQDPVSGSGQLRAWLPGAVAVQARLADGSTVDYADAGGGLFVADLPAARLPDGPTYRLPLPWPGAVQDTADPYAFGPLLGELDLHLIREGRHLNLGDCLGAHACQAQSVAGVRFAVWAPNARRVSVVGDFNSWDGRRHIMRLRHDAGVWELFVPGLAPGERYKYEIVGPDGAVLPLKADPVARQ